MSKEYIGTSFVQQIYDFNKNAGLLEKGYDDFLESSFQIEEALEGFAHTTHLAEMLGHPSKNSPKELSRIIVALSQKGRPRGPDFTCVWNNIPDIERLDKAIDAIVFAVGSIAKLGLTPEQIERAILVVTEANLQKLTMPKDEYGKLTKPADFVGPEVKLQEILNELT